MYEFIRHDDNGCLGAKATIGTSDLYCLTEHRCIIKYVGGVGG